MWNSLRVSILSAVVLALHGCGGSGSSGPGGSVGASLTLSDAGSVTGAATISGSRGVSLTVPAGTEVSAADGTVPTGSLSIEVDDRVASGVPGPDGATPLVEVRVQLRGGAAALEAFLAPSGTSKDRGWPAGRAEESGAQLSIPAALLPAGQECVLLYRLSSSGPDSVSREGSSPSWQYVGQSGTVPQAAFPLATTGHFGVFAASGDTTLPLDGFELRHTSTKPVDRLMLIDRGTSEVIGVWQFGTSTDSVRVSGPANERFWCQLTASGAGHEVRIRSAFANQGVLRVVYADGSTGTVEPSGPFMVQGGQAGAAVSNPYDNASLQFAGMVGLVVKAPQGGWTELSRDVLDPLRRAGHWQASDVVLRNLRAQTTGGYVARIDVLTQRCRNDVLSVLAGSPQVRSKVDRYVEVEYSFTTIQAAIDAAADGATVTIPPGRYRERIDFKSRKITLRSSDPTDAAVVAATIIDGSGGAPVVRFGSGETAQSVLDGVTVTGGAASAGSGGGIAIGNASSPTIRRCVIEGNTASDTGGGVFVAEKSAPVIEENVIRKNTAAVGGGGLYSEDASPTVRNNRVVENKALGYLPNGGGGIACHGPGAVSITGNTVETNSAFASASLAGAEGGTGGGILVSGYKGMLTAVITSNQVAGNTAVVGGGIGVEPGVTATLESNQISRNRAADGGGIGLRGFDPGIAACPVVVRGNTVEENRAEPWFPQGERQGTGRGGGVYFSEVFAEIRGNTLRANAAIDGSGIAGWARLRSGQVTVAGNTFSSHALLDLPDPYGIVGSEQQGATLSIDVYVLTDIDVTLDTSGNTFSGNEGNDERITRRRAR